MNMEKRLCDNCFSKISISIFQKKEDDTYEKMDLVCDVHGADLDRPCHLGVCRNQPHGTAWGYAVEAGQVNEQRAEHGLAALSYDWELSRVARYKSQDMADQGYFTHTSPTYGSPFQMIRNFGLTYRSAGENIAKGYATPQEVVNAWMRSSGHRANILNASFTKIGVGYVSEGRHWTQMFIGS